MYRKKQKRPFTIFDASKSNGWVYVLGLHEVGSGDAQAQLDLLKEMVGDVNEFAKKYFSENFFSSVKNLMSDRCNTQKKFNKLFIDYRSTVLPKIKSNWNELSEDEKAKHLNVHQYFCGLHFLVALADTSEACLKLWEGTVFQDPKEVGALSHGSYSNGESGPLRLIRTICKLVQERGCEKSGRMVTFSTFLKESHNIISLPLYPFLGNRFNILFLNGAGVFYLYNYLIEFLENVSLDNKLMSAAFYDLHVLAYKVACQALGLIDKLVTGPLWRTMVKEKEVLDMSLHYQKMYDFFKQCAADPSLFLDGTNLPFPDLIIEDDRLTALLNIESDEEGLMLKQCLSLIFAGFVTVSERMLEDHLIGGKYSEPNEELRRESMGVPTTNANPERDFGILDRLMKLKPKALDIIYEGMIMFTRNNTSKWRDSLSKEELTKAMKFARESKSKQKQLYYQRKIAIHQTRAEKLQSSIEEKRKKELAQSAEKEKLTHQIEEIGDLWSSEKVAKEKLSSFKTEKEKRAALKTQLIFRQKVLGTNCDKNLFYMSSKGNIRSSEELLENLKKVIGASSYNYIEPDKNVNYSLPIVIPPEKLNEQKQKICDKGKRNAAQQDYVAKKKKKWMIKSMSQ